MKRHFAVVILLAVPLLGAAQSGDQTPNSTPPESQQQRREGGMRAHQGVAGRISEMKPGGFTLKTMQGKTVTVKVTADTRFMKERQPAKLADFSAGDMVRVGGEPSGEETWTARFVGSRTGGFGSGGGQGDTEALREDMGKKFIAGEVKAIDGTKLTIARPDGQTQVIEVDENTSFRKGRESITLPDIKVGDHVFGRGQLNSADVFVATTLNVGEMRMMMGAPGEGERTRKSSPQPPE